MERTQLLTIRLAEEEHERFVRLAELDGQTVSAMVRLLVLAECRRRNVKCEPRSRQP